MTKEVSIVLNLSLHRDGDSGFNKNEWERSQEQKSVGCGIQIQVSWDRSLTTSLNFDGNEVLEIVW